MQPPDELVEQLLPVLRQPLAAKARYLVVVWGRSSIEQPDEVDFPGAGEAIALLEYILCI